MTPITTLKKSELFQGMDDAILKDIAEFSDIRDFKDGDRILSEVSGEKGPGIYLKLRGEVVIGKKFVESEGAKDVDFKPVNSPIFGEISWLLGDKPSAELKSRGDSRFIVVDADRLWRLCEEELAIGYQVMKRLAKLLAQRTVNLTQLTTQVSSKPSVFEF